MNKEEIIKNRIKLGWSQEELSEYSGIILQSILDFEDGKRIASAPISNLLSKTFKRKELEMTTRLDYVKWDQISENKQQIVKKMYQDIELFITESIEESREKSLTLTKLEESWMWIGKSIKIDQEKRTNKCLQS